jgi:hypothetical protein
LFECYDDLFYSFFPAQYWQGIGTAGSTLMSNVDIDMDIATTMSKVDSRQGSVPFIHFGLIELEKDMGFVVGGFSRVYFGKYNNKQIALKMLYVMELTPRTVSDFCQEARLLSKLKHDNVIQCRGVCVMPPAISIVLEFCKYGSLFDVLYKPRNNKQSFFAQGLKIVFGQDFTGKDMQNEITSPLGSEGDRGSNGRQSFTERRSMTDKRSLTDRLSANEVQMPKRGSSESDSFSENLMRAAHPSGGSNVGLDSAMPTNRDSFVSKKSHASSGGHREASHIHSSSLNDPRKLLLAHSQAKVLKLILLHLMI